MPSKLLKKLKDFNNAMGQESLTRFDQPKKSKRNNKKKSGEMLLWQYQKTSR
jgi:hypothetical protein